MKLGTSSKRAGATCHRFAWLAVVWLVGGLAGCDMDSYLDPSITGRWENTPVVLPILDRLDVIEEPEENIAGLTQVRSSDLIPEVSEYALGPGDLITVTVFELITPNIESVQTRRIDELGYIRLPVIGQLRATGLTTKQLEQKIVDILDPDILRNPTVTVIVQEGRQKTFNVLGAAGAVGTYTLLQSRFRLLDAIALARGIPSDVEKIYVIRQVPLSDLVERGYMPAGDEGDYQPPMKPSTNGDGAGNENPVDVLEDLTRELEGGGAAAPDTTDKPLDLTVPDGDVKVAAPLAEAIEGGDDAGGRWVNVGGQWIKVQPGAGEPTTAPTSDASPLAEGGLPAPDQMVTQRVIEIDAQELMKGVARYNIIIRPGDMIRVPSPQTGNIFIGGAVARPGTYALPGERELTLTQALKAAGGLSPVGIPERVDLRRRLDRNTEAVIRLNYRAIAEGVQPNIFLKANDEINIGTNLIASFAAVFRNSFRSSYGFGFLLDRNFDQNVFGPDLNR